MADSLRSPLSTRILVVLPVFNDWEACEAVLERVDHAVALSGRQARFLVVDDGSTQPCTLDRNRLERTVSGSVKLLVLRRNLGHQRAICVALAAIAEGRSCDVAVIMDADGEDDPDDVPRLLDKWEESGGEKIVFAERTRRSEGLAFRASYWAFRMVHRVLTGRAVRVGHFSVIPIDRIRTLIMYPELWSHYAATVFISQLPFVMVPTQRAVRLVGKSRMNFVGLVAHGLSAVTVFSEIVGIRVVLANIVLVGISGIGLLGLLGASVFLPWQIPSWMMVWAGVLVVLIFVSIMFAFLFTFIILFGRKGGSMIPARDATLFIRETLVISPSRTGDLAR